MKDDIIGFLKEDWAKLPGTARFMLYGGGFFILIAWVGDHWSDSTQYHILQINNEVLFNIGFILVSVAFVFLFLEKIWIYKRIWQLRHKYPLEKLDKVNGFYLVNFRENWIFLFDDNHKQRFHIKNPQTVNDLWPLGEWTSVQQSKDDPPDTELTLRNGTKIILKEYPLNPSGIHTQGITGI